MFDRKGKKFISLRELRSLFNSGATVSEKVGNDNKLIKNLNTDNQFEGIEWYVSKLDSNTNYYKVESHAILTKTLFLMCTHRCAVSFDNGFQIVVICFNNDTTVYLDWRTPDELGKILYVILENTKFNSCDSDDYSNYRQATRIITDNLEADHQPRKTWVDILNLTYVYFGGVGYVI